MSVLTQPVMGADGLPCPLAKSSLVHQRAQSGGDLSDLVLGWTGWLGHITIPTTSEGHSISRQKACGCPRVPEGEACIDHGEREKGGSAREQVGGPERHRGWGWGHLSPKGR